MGQFPQWLGQATARGPEEQARCVCIGVYLYDASERCPLSRSSLSLPLSLSLSLSLSAFDYMLTSSATQRNSSTRCGKNGHPSQTRSTPPSQACSGNVSRQESLCASKGQRSARGVISASARRMMCLSSWQPLPPRRAPRRCLRRYLEDCHTRTPSLARVRVLSLPLSPGSCLFSFR